MNRSRSRSRIISYQIIIVILIVMIANLINLINHESTVTVQCHCLLMTDSSDSDMKIIYHDDE